METVTDRSCSGCCARSERETGRTIERIDHHPYISCSSSLTPMETSGSSSGLSTAWDEGTACYRVARTVIALRVLLPRCTCCYRIAHVVTAFHEFTSLYTTSSCVMAVKVSTVKISWIRDFDSHFFVQSAE